MVQRVATVAFEGIEARAVDVQVQVAPGLPAFNLAGRQCQLSVPLADCSGSLLARPFAFEGVARDFQSRAKAPWMRYEFGAACNVTNGGESLSLQCPLLPPIADIRSRARHVRLCANSGLSRLAKRYYSIRSSARARSAGGTASPSALAVLRLIASSYLVGACTGRSAGFSPFRIRSA